MQTNRMCQDKIPFILNSLACGKSRDEVASLLGYKTWRSLDIYMRRAGSRWDSKSNTYIDSHDGGENDNRMAEAEPKAASIMSKFSQKSPTRCKSR